MVAINNDQYEPPIRSFDPNPADNSSAIVVNHPVSTTGPLDRQLHRLAQPGVRSGAARPQGVSVLLPLGVQVWRQVRAIRPQRMVPVRAYRPGVMPTTRLKCRVRWDWS